MNKVRQMKYLDAKAAHLEQAPRWHCHSPEFLRKRNEKAAALRAAAKKLREELRNEE